MDTIAIRDELMNLIFDYKFDSSFEISNGNGTTSILDVSYINKKGVYEKLSKSASAGKTTGLVFLVIMIICTVVLGGKWLFEKHHIHRYANMPILSTNNTDDRVR